MANTTILCLPRQWTLLTVSDVDTLRAENQGEYAGDMQATPDTDPPANGDLGGTLKLHAGERLLPDYSVQELWPGVPDAKRVWLWNPSPSPLSVSVSHA